MGNGKLPLLRSDVHEALAISKDQPTKRTSKFLGKTSWNLALLEINAKSVDVVLSPCVGRVKGNPVVLL